jgi:hypothetical protein
MADKMNLDEMLKSYKTSTGSETTLTTETATTEITEETPKQVVVENKEDKKGTNTDEIPELIAVSKKSAKSQKAVLHAKKAMQKAFSKKKFAREKLDKLVAEYFSSVAVKDCALKTFGAKESEYSAHTPVVIGGYDYSCDSIKEFKGYFLPEVYAKAILLFGSNKMLACIHRENILTGETLCSSYEVFYSKISSIGVKQQLKKVADKKVSAKYTVLSLGAGEVILLPLAKENLADMPELLSAIKFIESKIV